MKLEDGDSPYGRFVSPSGTEIRTFREDTPLPPEIELKVNYLGSLSSTAEVLATFDEEKKDIVRSIRFGGLLNFAQFGSFDMYFCLWVMTKLDCARCSIRTVRGEEIPIRDGDIGNILGIPCYGIEVFVEPQASAETTSEILKILKKADSEATITMNHMEKILKKKHSGGMTDADIDAFKIAFVVVTMSNVLATGGNPGIVPLGILKLLTEPAKIHHFNWALLVRRYLVSWCHLIQQQLRLSQVKLTIGGCFLVPMVAYLDNLELGAATMLHYEFPRSGVYNCEMLIPMIAADTRISTIPENGREFGISEVKSGTNLCYGRWYVDTKVGLQLPMKRKSEIVLAEFSRNDKHRKGLVSKLVLLQANKSMKREIMRSTGMERIRNAALLVRKGDDFKVEQKMDAFIEQLRISDTTRPSKCSRFFTELKEILVLEGHKTWFHHLNPYAIKINGYMLEKQLSDGGRYCTNVCDAILRDQVLTEDVVFAGNDNRERHLIGASFVETYRDRDMKLGLDQLRVFFKGPHVKYSVADCIQINMPVSSRRTWSCYSWNLKERTLTVLDPLMMKGKVSNIKLKHQDIADEINIALFSCLKSFFPSYGIEENEWTTIYRNDISDTCKWSDTGLYAMHYALTFNTDRLTEEINWEHDFMGRWRSLWQILGTEGNVGVKPKRFTEILNED